MHFFCRGADGRGRLEDGRGGGMCPNGDSNPGCNYLVRGCSRSMHFFSGEVSCPVILLPSIFGGAERGHGHVRGRWVAYPGPRPGSRPRTCALAGGCAPAVPGADGRGRLEDGRGGGMCPNG